MLFFTHTQTHINTRETKITSIKHTKIIKQVLDKNKFMGIKKKMCPIYVPCRMNNKKEVFYW